MLTLNVCAAAEKFVELCKVKKIDLFDFNITSLT